MPSSLIGLGWLAFACSCALILWGANRGFDVTDEGLYLLLCNEPGSYPEMMTQYHVLVQPILHLTGSSPIALRLVRFGLLLGAHLAFALALQHWWRRTWPEAHAAMRGVAWPVILMGIPASYIWAPQSLGYNDLVGVCGLLSAAGLMCAVASAGLSAKTPHRGAGQKNHLMATGTQLSGGPAAGRIRPPCWSWAWLLGTGCCVALLAFAKWPSSICVFLLIVLAVLCLFLSRGWGFAAIALLALITGGGLGIAVVHLCILDVSAYLGSFMTVLKATATTHHHPPGSLLADYTRQLTRSYGLVLRYFGWAACLLLVLPMMSGRRSAVPPLLERWAMPSAVFVGVIAMAERLRYFRGSGEYSAQAVEGWWVLVTLMAALAATGWWRRRQLRHLVLGKLSVSTAQPAFGFWIIVGVLLLLPLAASVGTNTRITSPSVWLSGAWFGVAALLGGISWRHRPARPATVLCLGLVLVMILAQFCYGHVHRPYRLAAPLTRQTERVSILPNARGLMFDKATAKLLVDLGTAYQAAEPVANQPILAFYSTPGLVYLLGGRAPIIAWYSGRGTVHSLLSHGWTVRGETTLPFLLLTEELDPEIQAALQTIGVPFPQAYDLAVETTSPVDGCVMKLYVPRRPHR